MANPYGVVTPSMTPHERVAYFVEWIKEHPEYSYFDGHPLKNATLLSVEPRDLKAADKTRPVVAAVWKVLVVPEMCNAAGSVHGGAIATLFDMLTSFTFRGIEGIFGTGWEVNNISRTLNCTYLKPVMQGQHMRIECEVTAVGKRLALARAVVRQWNKKTADGSGGDICCTCEHGKVNAGPITAKL